MEGRTDGRTFGWTEGRGGYLIYDRQGTDQHNRNTVMNARMGTEEDRNSEPRILREKKL